MMEQFLKDLNDHTRATYYVLPLISLNKFSFGPPENYVDAYVTKDNQRVVVVVKDSSLAYPVVHNEAPLETFTDTRFVFKIPRQFKTDIEMFWHGSYSKFRNEAKELIKRFAGISNNTTLLDKEKKQKLYTDARLLALDRDVQLREFLEYELAVHINPDSELISPPGINEVWNEVEGPVTVE